MSPASHSVYGPKIINIRNAIASTIGQFFVVNLDMRKISHSGWLGDRSVFKKLNVDAPNC